MQKTTAIKIVTEIKVNYRYTFKDTTDAEMKLLVERWYDCLKPYTDEQVEEAFRVALCKFSVPPTVADIIEIISRQQRLKEPTDMELWQIIVRGVKELGKCRWTEKFGYQPEGWYRGEFAQEVYFKLPPILKEAYDFESFCDLSAMSEADLRAERSRFLKTIGSLRDTVQERNLSHLPQPEQIPKLRGGN